MKKANVTEDSKIWEILTEAKKHLSKTAYIDRDVANGKTEFICFSITLALGEKRHSLMTSKVHKLIYSRLKDSPYWLYQQGYVECASQAYKNRGKKLQQTRHNWVDSMIAEFKAKDM